MPTNLAATTREMWIRTFKHQALMRIPILNSLLKRRKITVVAGTEIKLIVGKADLESLAQEYIINDPLTAATKELYANPEFKWKYMQLPIEIDGDEETENKPKGDHKIIDLAKNMTQQGQEGMKLKLRTVMFHANSGTSDSDKGFQGFQDALVFDGDYGTLGRTTTTENSWWQGASWGGAFADQGTARSMNIETIRQTIRASGKYADRMLSDIKIVVAPTNFIKLQSEMETRMLYKTDGELAKQGFQAMTLDGVEIVADYYLDNDSTLAKYLFLIHLPDWELRLHPSRNFRLTDPVWQGQITNGYDKYLSRILVKGNLFCRQPNASMFLSNVS